MSQDHKAKNAKSWILLSGFVSWSFAGNTKLALHLHESGPSVKKEAQILVHAQL